MPLLLAVTWLPLVFAADPDACEAYVADSFPRAGDTDVPVDSVPVVVIDRIECDPVEWRIELVDEGAGLVVAESTAGTGIGLLELPMPGPLQANAAYTLRITDPSGLAEVVEVGFTTGTGTAGWTPWAPALSAAFATWSRPAGPLTVGVSVALPDGGTEPGLVMLGHTGATADGEPEGRVAGLLDDAVDDYAWSVSLDEGPDTWCVWGRGRGADGSWFDAAEPLCVPVEAVLREPSGATCATGGPPGAGLIGVLLLAAGIGRRAPRRP